MGTNDRDGGLLGDKEGDKDREGDDGDKLGANDTNGGWLGDNDGGKLRQTL